MRFEVQEEIKTLKNKISKGEISLDDYNRFVSEIEYEDDYSGNETLDIQEEFIYYAQKYLKENYPGQYAIICEGEDLKWNCMNI